MDAKTLILTTTKPKVAFVCSQRVKTVAQKYNMTFSELIEPYCRSNSKELSWLDPTGQRVFSRFIDVLPVDLETWTSVRSDGSRNRAVYTEVLTRNPPPTDIFDYNIHEFKNKMLSYSIRAPKATPWFLEWRKVFFKLYNEQKKSSQHDYLAHFLGCVFVISPKEAESLESLKTSVSQLEKCQLDHQYEWPQMWAFPTALKYYILLHDETCGSDESASLSALQNLRTMFGINACAMLKLNHSNCALSNSIPSNDMMNHDNIHNSVDHVKESININPNEILHPLSPHRETNSVTESLNGLQRPTDSFSGDNACEKLSDTDCVNIKESFTEFYKRAMLPYIERQTKILHENIVNKRGMGKYLSNATKRLFGSSIKSPTTIIYAPDSTEMTSRKLADLYFLFGNYSGAYHLYHQIKKEFSADSAWIYYASAVEMACFSHFLMTQSEPPQATLRSFPVHYLDDAISHYMDNCRMPEAATRCALIGSECLKQLNNYSDAASLFIRMTSEDCDLRSALMLEQASNAFLKLESPRKYAMHCILAGHRFLKAGLRAHSLNNYNQALQVYWESGWRFAEDHINFTIARLKYHLGLKDEAILHLKKLFRDKSTQPPHQNVAFLKELLTSLSENSKDRVEDFNIPKICSEDIRISISEIVENDRNVLSSSETEYFGITCWQDLEEKVVRQCIDTSLMMLKPTRLTFHRNTDNSHHPKVPCGENFSIYIPLKNELNISLDISNSRLVFSDPEIAKFDPIKYLHLEPGETKTLRFVVSCDVMGIITLEKLQYDIELGSLRVSFSQRISIRGKRISPWNDERNKKKETEDFRNQYNIIEKLPLLQAIAEEVPGTLYKGQLIHFEMMFRDYSADYSHGKYITDIILASSNIRDVLEVMKNEKLNLVNRENTLIHLKLNSPMCASEFASTCSIPCVLRVPNEGEDINLNFMVVYKFDISSDTSTKDTYKYRVTQLNLSHNLKPSLLMEYSTLRFIDSSSSFGTIRIGNVSDTSFSVTQMKFSSEIDLEMIADPASFSSNQQLLDVSSDQKVLLKPGHFHQTLFRLKSRRNSELAEWPHSEKLIVSWNIIQDAEGFSLLGEGETVLNVHAENLMSLKSNALTVQVDHYGSAEHDFTETPVFTYCVKLRVFSSKCMKAILRIEEEAESENEVESGRNFKASRKGIKFLGKSCWCLDLKSHSPGIIVYKVCMTKPGIYNVAPVLKAHFVETGQDEQYVLHSPLIITQTKLQIND